MLRQAQHERNQLVQHFLSGESTLVIGTNGSRLFRKNVQKWQGVALACRFDTEQVKNYKKHNEDDVITSLLNLLGAQS